jgi:hypothetical protein
MRIPGEVRELINQAVRDAEAVRDLPDAGAPPPDHVNVYQPSIHPHDQALLLVSANLFHLRVRKYERQGA